ncbi:MAG: response regulator transcription factor [Chloroflexaceae bacterium]|nr:response regulator transcription factor [Chloroflexaceae bacterium]NJO06489.1 response regulator transcription factor [Chloroflexaceae bacterium]
MEAATILVVDDEQSIVDLVVGYLAREGFEVHAANDGIAALAMARELRPQLVILDLMLPGMDGIEVCRRLQQEIPTYIMMLTARSEEIDKVIGLSVGADDYMTKPFSPRELVARVKAILRRSRHLPEWSGAPQTLLYGSLTIYPDRREVWRDGVLLELTPREFDLLHALARKPGYVFSREELLRQVWGHDFAGIDRVVDVHVGVLRRKLEEDGALIQTVRGVGYKFVTKQ